MSKGLFITGTGTDVGKTYVTALLLKKLRTHGLNAVYYKAALSGNERRNGTLIPGDSAYVTKAANIPKDPSDLVSYIYEAAVSPHLAAKLEGQEVELAKIQKDFQTLAHQFDYLVMEGSGGIICPIRTGDTPIMLEDFIHMFQLNVLMVADANLGTINNVVLTAAYAKAHNINIKGIIINHWEAGNFLHQDNLKMMEQLTHLPVLDCISENDSNCHISSQTLSELFNPL